MAAIPLLDLPPGSRGTLVLSGGEERTRHRLRELGFVAGTEVSVVRRMPLGGAVEVSIRGCRVCVRRQDLEGLQVLPIEAAP
jgi:ferrous iron transport protein A